MAEVNELKSYIVQKFSDCVGLTPEELYGADLTLAQIITRSERMTNSVDLMEAFAKTANGLRKDHGIRVRLPAMSLDTPISKVLEVFIQEVEQEKGRAA